MKETLKRKEAFDFYYSLGADRTLLAVALRFGNGKRTVEGWSKELNWQGRVLQRDLEIGKKLEERTNKAVLDSKAEYRNDIQKIIAYHKGLLNTTKKKIENGELQVTNVLEFERIISSFVKTIKLDMLLVGEATVNFGWKDIIYAAADLVDDVEAEEEAGTETDVTASAEDSTRLPHEIQERT